MERIEQWLPVVGFEGSYEVSDLGRIRSVDRVIDAAHGAWRQPGLVVMGKRRLKGKIIRPGRAASGHLNNTQIGKGVHVIVAEAFIGPRPAGMETRHIDGDPSNNRLENLEYGTRSENAEDSKRHGTHFHAGVTHCKRGHELTGDNLQKHANVERTCLACRRERQQTYNHGGQLVPEGFCPNGHPKTPENRYTNGPRGTRCKPCALERRRKTA
jgi:hypothetical protein